jgi:hypothetical protein
MFINVLSKVYGFTIELPINFDAGYVPNILDVKLLDEVVKVRRCQPVNILIINGPYCISNLTKVFFFFFILLLVKRMKIN